MTKLIDLIMFSNVSVIHAVEVHELISTSSVLVFEALKFASNKRSSKANIIVSYPRALI